MPTYSASTQGNLALVGDLTVESFSRLDSYIIPTNQATGLIDYSSRKGRRLTATEKIALDIVTIHPNLIRLMWAIQNYFPEWAIGTTNHGGHRRRATVNGQDVDLNKAVSGARKSQHIWGTAADIYLRHRVTGEYMDTSKLIVWCEYIASKIGIYGGFGIYAGAWNYVHVDVRGAPTAWFESYNGNRLSTQGGRSFTFHYNGSKNPALWQRAAGIRLEQRALKKLGYKISEDGVFGPQTAAAFVDFQKKRGLVADGKPGRQTLMALNKAVGEVVLPWETRMAA
jgi:uncharacterized protein YcbK (DUF882 family)